jgi:hypothetical protein
MTYFIQQKTSRQFEYPILSVRDGSFVELTKDKLYWTEDMK